MKTPIGGLVIAMLLMAGLASAQCPDGYEQIYVKCENTLTKSCVLSDRQPTCSGCWLVQYGPCVGSRYGGTKTFDSFQKAKETADYDSQADDSCPWYNDQDFKIVLNDRNSCLHKPKGNEMGPSGGQRPVGLQTTTSFGNMDEFIGDELKFTKEGDGTVTQISSPIGSGPRSNNSGFSSADEAEIWRQVEAILGTLPADVRAALQQYLPAIFEGLLNGDSTALIELIDQHTNSSVGSNYVSPPSTSYGNMNDFLGDELRFTNPNTGAQISSPIGNPGPAANAPNPSSGNTGSSSNAPASNNTPVDSWGNQENYVIFWLRNNEDGYQNQAFVRLNGNLLQLRPGAGKALLETSYEPNCQARENCDNVGFCPGVLRVKLSQRPNTWSAEIINGTNKAGSFTAKPGCNIVEIK
jgi:hypothetical protein